MTLFDKQVSRAPDTFRFKLPLTSPVSGTVVPLNQLPMAVFQHKLLGDGVAIVPSGYQVVAPFDGIVTHLPATAHQLHLKSKQGLQMQLHLGIGADRMMGEGFKLHTREGETVNAGQTLLEFDLRRLKPHLKSTLFALVIPNSDKFRAIHSHYHQVIGGQDPAMTLYL